jgi:hypothetical protein
MPTTTDEPLLTTNDRAALELALRTARQESAGRAEQLALKLAEDGWFATARFAAYSCQVDALHLQPWEWPPVWAGEDDDESPAEAVQLLRRMLKAGLSRFDPDPMAALEKAEKRATVG